MNLQEFDNYPLVPFDPLFELVMDDPDLASILLMLEDHPPPPQVCPEPKKPKPTRNRRMIPEDKTHLYIADRPRRTDVISGRGGRSNHHEGNKPYWRLVYAGRSDYKASKILSDKNAIAEEIVATIHSQEGRFLQREKGTNKWFRLPPKAVLEKVKQALRDDYIPEFLKEESGINF